jgi:uncharacterized protein YdeI (YjbR/CyaY-like superfamily)
MSRSAVKPFSATLERGNPSLGWVIARIPAEATKGKISGSRPRVKGKINGFSFQTSLFPDGNGSYYVLVNKKMQAGAKARLGSVAQFVLEPDTTERVIALPAELKEVLSEDRALHRWYDRLSEAKRKEIGDWILGVKSAEARTRRAEQIAERLMATMEAEQELPPILRAAFARNPLAQKGWEQMSQSHRRRQLFGIFYYRSPEARERRVAKAIEDCIRIAKNKKKDLAQ